MSGPCQLRIRWFTVVGLFTMGLFLGPVPSAHGQAVSGYCVSPNKINWPASDPVWSLCWVSPPASSGVDGSGLELRHVFYRGRRVFWRAHLPILNVKYDPGGCGGSDLSYRDWQNQLVAFEANNVLSPGYAEPTTPPRTVCDHPGTDAGSFAGVAVEKRSDRLILSTQIRAGWYRYIQKWIFLLDGTIETRMGFTAVDHPCTPLSHNHHVYWRFDFDIEGASNDLIQEYKRWWIFGWWSSKPYETNRRNRPSRRRKWRVRDKGTGRGYKLTPGSSDRVADTWAVADMWALRYHGDEIDDGGATGGSNGDAAHMNNYISGENINGRDVVLWYHAWARHEGAADCEIVGPTLRRVRSW